jgi:hypothetical protein
MSHHRELKQAQQELNAAVREFVQAEEFYEDGCRCSHCHPHRPPGERFASLGSEDRWLDSIAGVREAYSVFEELANQTEAEGAASARPTSIAASKNLSTVSSWRGKVQRAVYAAGMVQALGRPLRVRQPVAEYGGITCDELERKLGSHGHSAHHGSVSSAVNWAEKAGWIKDSGYVRETRSGNAASVYEPTQMLIDKIAEERRVA